MEPLTRAAGDGVADSALARTARARPAHIAPSATVWIGIDVRVGGSAADFVDVPPAANQPVDADSVVVEAPVPAKGLALVRAADAGFAGTLHRAIVPAQVRLSNEVDQLQQIRNATLHYLKTLPSNEGEPLMAGRRLPTPLWSMAVRASLVRLNPEPELPCSAEQSAALDDLASRTAGRVRRKTTTSLAAGRRAFPTVVVPAGASAGAARGQITAIDARR